MAKNKKEIKYPKPSDSKKKENVNNIKIYPKDETSDSSSDTKDSNIINNNIDRNKNNKKKNKTKNKYIKNKGKENKSKPSKNKINLLIKNINRLSITKEEESGYKYNNNEIIYNENPLEEYEDEIMNYLFKYENKNRPNYSLFPQIRDSNDNTINVNYMKRFSFINLFISFQQELYLKQETLYLSINLFDRYIQILNSKKIMSCDTHIIAITCLFIASKYEEIYAPYLKEYLQIFTHKYTKRDIFIAEDEILSALNFDILTINPILFLKKICLYNIDKLTKKEKNDMEMCYNGAQFLMELCLIEPKFCEFKPSLQAAICLYLARKILLFNNGKGKIWTFDLEFRSNYSENVIKKNMKIVINTINSFFRNIYTKNFMALPLYNKYCSLEYLKISIKLKAILVIGQDG